MLVGSHNKEEVNLLTRTVCIIHDDHIITFGLQKKEKMDVYIIFLYIRQKINNKPAYFLSEGGWTFTRKNNNFPIQHFLPVCVFTSRFDQDVTERHWGIKLFPIFFIILQNAREIMKKPTVVSYHQSRVFMQPSTLILIPDGAETCISRASSVL